MWFISPFSNTPLPDKLPDDIAAVIKAGGPGSGRRPGFTHKDNDKFGEHGEKSKELERLQSQPNYQATFERTNPGASNKYDVLMRTETGGHYWQTPDYGGIASGATRTFSPDITKSFLKDGSLKHVHGTPPAELSD